MFPFASSLVRCPALLLRLPLEAGSAAAAGAFFAACSRRLHKALCNATQRRSLVSCSSTSQLRSRTGICSTRFPAIRGRKAADPSPADLSVSCASLTCACAPGIREKSDCFPRVRQCDRVSFESFHGGPSRTPTRSTGKSAPYISVGRLLSPAGRTAAPHRLSPFRSVPSHPRSRAALNTTLPCAQPRNARAAMAAATGAGSAR